MKKINFATTAVLSAHIAHEEQAFEQFAPIVLAYIKHQLSEAPSYFTTACEHLALKMEAHYRELVQVSRMERPFGDYLVNGIEETDWKEVAQRFLQRFYPELLEEHADASND